MDYFRGRLHALRSHFHSTAENENGPANAPVIASAHEDIARLAYSYWQARGRQDGSALEDWLRAEREIERRQ
jgi:hypothetical protein